MNINKSNPPKSYLFLTTGSFSLHRFIISLVKMKFQNVIILFTAAVSATGPPTCKGSSPSYCKYTSNRDATECKRFFGKAQSSPGTKGCFTTVTNYLIFSQELHQRRNMSTSSQDRYLNEYQVRYCRHHKDAGATTNNYKDLHDHNQDWQTVSSLLLHRVTIRINREWKSLQLYWAN